VCQGLKWFNVKRLTPLYFQTTETHCLYSTVGVQFFEQNVTIPNIAVSWVDTVVLVFIIFLISSREVLVEYLKMDRSYF
jgi:hypothetical protein